MKKMEYITINDINYIIFDSITLNNQKYLYLVNENDETDFLINKIIIKDNKEFIVNLDSKEEFTEAFKVFGNKQKAS